jgi:hypothetical protein
MRLRSNPLEAIVETAKEAFSGETLETILHTGLGVGGALAGTKLITDQIPAIATPVGGIAVSAGVSILGSTLIGMLGKDKVLATRFLAGGMLATALHALGLVLPAEAKAWVPTVGLGQAESREFAAAVQEEVLQRLQAGKGYVPPAGAAAYRQPAGVSAYLTNREAKGAGVGAYMTEREALTAGVGAYDEISGSSAPERF